MTDPSGMHQLHEDSATCLMDAIGHASPALYLFLVEQSGNARIAKAVGRRRGALGDDQSGIRAQAVILFHHGVGRVADGAAARERCHDDAVLQRQAAELGGGE